nr:immunoglobulin light chain junction region [Macaca mulatta]
CYSYRSGSSYIF